MPVTYFWNFHLFLFNRIIDVFIDLKYYYNMFFLVLIHKYYDCFGDDVMPVSYVGNFHSFY